MNTSLMAKFKRRDDAIEALNAINKNCRAVQTKLINRENFKHFIVNQHLEKRNFQLLAYSCVGVLVGMAMGFTMDFFLTESMSFRSYMGEHLAIFITLGIVGGLLAANAIYFISRESEVILDEHDMDNSRYLALVEVPQEEDSKAIKLLESFKALKVKHA